MDSNSNENSDGSLSLINYDEDENNSQNDFNEEEMETSFIDLNNYGVLNVDDSNMDDIRNLSVFGKMNSSMRDRKLNSSTQNEKSFRKKNSKNNNNNDKDHSKNIPESESNLKNKEDGPTNELNSGFKNELQNFLRENNNLDFSKNKNNLVELEKQKIIEINEEEDEKSVEITISFNDKRNENANKNIKSGKDNLENSINVDKCNNQKESYSKNPLEKFENLYLQGKSENKNQTNNNYIKYQNNSEEVPNLIMSDDEVSAKKYNKILGSNDIKQLESPNLQIKISIENFDSNLDQEEEFNEEENEALHDHNNFEENGEIEEIFNNFNDKVQKEAAAECGERFISQDEINNMDKDELIKMILNSDLVNKNNKHCRVGSLIDSADVDDIGEKISFHNEKNIENINSVDNENDNLLISTDKKNKFKFAPRNKNSESNSNNNLYKKKPIDKKQNPVDDRNPNAMKSNERVGLAASKEKAVSPFKKSRIQPKKAKENSVNKYNPKQLNKPIIKDNSSKQQNMAKKNINNLDLNNENNNKKDINSKIKDFSTNKNSQESNQGSNPLFNNIEEIEKNEDTEKITDEVLIEIENLEEELDSKQILEMLLYNKNQLENEINQLGKNRVDENNKKWLEKKTKNLEMIQDKIDEEYKKICTFAPNTNNTDKKNRRNLEQFLNDQNEFQKKIASKKQDLQSYKEKESLKENQTAPKINEYSKKLLEDKNANKDPVYQRLYNMRGSKDEKLLINNLNNNNNKNNKAKNDLPENNKKLKNKSTTHHSKDISTANNNDLETNPDHAENEDLVYKAVNTEENLQRKSLINNNNNINTKNNRKSKVISSKLVKKVDFINPDGNNNKKAERARDLQKCNSNKNINFKNPLENNSNKYIFNKYTALFRSVFEELFNEFLNSGVELDYMKGVNSEFLLQLFYRLKLFDLPSNALSDNPEYEKSLTNEELNNMVKAAETNLFCEIFENLCDSEGYVSIDHFYIFSLAILDLLDYYILKAYLDKEKELEKDAKVSKNTAVTPLKMNPNSENKNANLFVIDKNTIEKINAELKAKIILSKKYGGYDEANNYIITFEQGKKIHKDFLCFSANWYKSIRSKNKNKEIENLAAESVTFKPKINPKSAKIGEEYRRKVISDLDAEMKDKKSQNYNNLDYLEILNIKKKRQEKLNQKLREEQMKEALKDCTFKPKINTNYKKDNVYQVDNNAVDRYDLLFKLGTQSIIQKKDKTRNDYEIEKYGDECTFKPNINTEFSPKFQQKNEFFNEKELEKFNDRMRKGRIDKEIKDSALKRGEALYHPNQMKFEEVNKIKTNKSEEKLFSRKNPENANYHNLKTDYNEEAFGNFTPDNIAKSCAIPKTTKNKSSANNLENFASISPINSKNLNEIRPNKLNFNNQNSYNNNNDYINNQMLRNPNQNHVQRKSQNGSSYSNEAANRKPILIIDVKLKEGNMSHIKVYEGDTAENLSNEFAEANGLDEKMRGKLKKLVQNEINKLLTRIQEETSSMKNTMNEK